MGAPVPVLPGQLKGISRLRRPFCLHHEEIVAALLIEHRSSRQVHEALAFGLSVVSNLWDPYGREQ